MPTDWPADIGDRVRAARAYHGGPRGSLGQKELADKTGISVSTIHRIEDGSRRPTTDDIDKIADACGLQMAFFQANLNHMPYMVRCIEVALSRSTRKMERLTDELEELLTPEHQRTD